MFKNKIVAITGAGSGIGRALAVNLSERGAILALSDINMDGLNKTLSLLAPKTQAKSYEVNVASREEVDRFANDVEVDFGIAHYIFNNAGTSIFGTVENMSIEELEHVLNINMWGVIYGTKAFMSKMLKQNEGCIVNISSVFGLAASPSQVAYNMSKFAVRGLTETLWTELQGTGVRAVLVHPGGIKTDIKNGSPLCRDGGEYEAQIQKASGETLITPPEDCAEEIVKGLLSGKNRLLVGSGAKTLHWLTRIFPNSHMKIIGKKIGL